MLILVITALGPMDDIVICNPLQGCNNRCCAGNEISGGRSNVCMKQVPLHVANAAKIAVTCFRTSVSVFG